MEYVDEYLPYIRYVCRKRQFLKNQWEDMEQFIVTELLAVFHKRDRYDDFDWVVRSIIRRKAIDFTSYYIKRNENIMFEDEINDKDGASKKSDHDSGIMSSFYAEKALLVNKEKDISMKIIEFILEIQHRICKGQYSTCFSDWDREYLEVILELYQLGYEVLKKDIMECMGYEPNEITKFNSKLLSFRNKLKKHLDLEVTFVEG
jgi:hypothetical protein